jgi:hypothetical protein
MGTDWIENERFELVLAKTIIFMPKTGSINSGTGLVRTFPATYFKMLKLVVEY